MADNRGARCRLGREGERWVARRCPTLHAQRPSPTAILTSRDHTLEIANEHQRGGEMPACLVGLESSHGATRPAWLTPLLRRRCATSAHNGVAGKRRELRAACRALLIHA